MIPTSLSSHKTSISFIDRNRSGSDQVIFKATTAPELVDPVSHKKQSPDEQLDAEDEARELAAELVRRFNAHDALVEELRKLVQRIEDEYPKAEALEYTGKSRDLLALVKGGAK